MPNMPPDRQAFTYPLWRGRGGGSLVPGALFQISAVPPSPLPPPPPDGLSGAQRPRGRGGDRGQRPLRTRLPRAAVQGAEGRGGAYFGGRPFLWALLRARLYKVRSGVACLLACPPLRVGVCTHMHPLEWLACAPPYGQCGALHRATFLLAISSIVHACPRAAYMHAAHAHNWTDGAVHRA